MLESQMSPRCTAQSYINSKQENGLLLYEISVIALITVTFPQTENVPSVTTHPL